MVQPDETKQEAGPELDFGKKKKKKVKASPEESPAEDAPEMKLDHDVEGEEVSDLNAMFGAKKKKKKDTVTPPRPETDDADNGTADVSPEKEKKEKKKKKEKKGAEEDLEDHGYEADVSEALATKKREKGKEKKQASSGCAGGELLVARIKAIRNIPKKDKLFLCDVALDDDGEPLAVVTNATNLKAGDIVVVAVADCVIEATGMEVKKTKVGGVESLGMLCGPLELGWEPSETFLAEQPLVLPEKLAAGLGKPAPPYEEVQALTQKSFAPLARNEKGKKGKQQKGAKPDDEEDLDALLNEFADKDGPSSNRAEAPAASVGKKGKKKGGAAKEAATDEEDLDALLNTFAEKDGEAPAAAFSSSAALGNAQRAEGGGVEEGPQEEEHDMDEEAKRKAEMNRKKKEKRKAKKEEATGGEGMWGDGAEPCEEKPPASAPAAAESKDKKGKKGPSSAIAKAAQERLILQRQLEEEKAAFEEEQKKIREEEERLEKERLEKEEEMRRKRREAKEAKKERMKAEYGKVLTKAEKERIARAEAYKKELEELGIIKGGGEQEEGKKKQSSMYTKKKKQRAMRDKEEEGEEKEEGTPKDSQQEEPEKSKQAKPEEVEEDDDWETKGADSPKAGKKAQGKKKPVVEGDDDDDEEAEGEEEDDEDEDDEDDDDDSDVFEGYRSPIVCIMGHVDTGKTKLLDKIRRTNVQEGEAGGITQQIGATFFPESELTRQTAKVENEFDVEVPGLLIIDTPGHESFNNLRSRGSSLCDIAILVVDIMHGLEPQTIESLEMLKKRKCPFVIALNKVDRMYEWKAGNYTAIRDSLDAQQQFVRDEFETRLRKILLQLTERGLNCDLYWESADMRRNVSVIPTSAMTGEGVPDLLYMILQLTQSLMASKLELKEDLECTVLEVKTIEGLGTTVDVVLVNGILREGDVIVLCGMNGPIATTVRALLTPQPLKEMRVKGEYVHHKEVKASMGVKICAPDLSNAIAGTQLLVCGPDDDLEDLKEEVMEDYCSILQDYEKATEGVYVMASTLGSLEALLSFLQESNIPVFEMNIGVVNKMDVKKAALMREKKHPEYAVILAFDVKVTAEAQKQATHDDVKIMTADIIYHLFDQFTEYIKEVKEAKKAESKGEAVFPCICKISPQYIFNKRDPIIVGCDIIAGVLKVGTPLCVPDKEFIEIGRVGSIEKEKKPVQEARRGVSVAVKIVPNTAQTHIAIGRHFDHTNELYSSISRQSIDKLKENFKDEVTKEDWQLIIQMKQLFKIT